MNRLASAGFMPFRTRAANIDWASSAVVAVSLTNCPVSGSLNVHDRPKGSDQRQTFGGP